jgi:uncharacterized protein (TIGR00730 family)
MFSASAQAYVFFPGGFGTMDEFFEMLTLIQTGKMAPVPVVCIGQDFWNPLNGWIKQVMLEEQKAIDPKDMNIYTVVDTAEQAFDLIKETKERRFF